MLDAPEIEHHHHRGGHGRIELIFGALAVFLSCVSVFIAVHHGRTMEKLVEANSWPNISFTSSNVSPDGTKPDIQLELRNTGVGPARIETFEVFYQNKPMATLHDLLHACCAGMGTEKFVTSTVRDTVVPARETIDFVRLNSDGVPSDHLVAFDRARRYIEARACYCSVFDECWVVESRQSRPTHVDVCAPSQEIQYND